MYNRVNWRILGILSRSLQKITKVSEAENWCKRRHVNFRGAERFNKLKSQNYRHDYRQKRIQTTNLLKNRGHASKRHRDGAIQPRQLRSWKSPSLTVRPSCMLQRNQRTKQPVNFRRCTLSWNTAKDSAKSVSARLRSADIGLARWKQTVHARRTTPFLTLAKRQIWRPTPKGNSQPRKVRSNSWRPRGRNRHIPWTSKRTGNKRHLSTIQPRIKISWTHPRLYWINCDPRKPRCLQESFTTTSPA